MRTIQQKVTFILILCIVIFTLITQSFGAPPPPPLGTLKVDVKWEPIPGVGLITGGPALYLLPVPNAGVHLRYFDVRNSGNKKTDARGNASFSKLTPGVYRVDLSNLSNLPGPDNYFTQFPTIWPWGTTSITMGVF